MQIPYIINLILLIIVVRKYGLLGINLKVASYYSLCVFGLIGSYFSLDGADWWLQGVDTLQLHHAYFSLNFIIAAFALALISQKKNSFPKIHIRHDEGAIVRLGFLFICASSVFFTLIFVFPNSALFELLTTGASDALLLAETRRAMGVREEGGALLIYFQNIVVRYFLPYIALYFMLSLYAGRVSKFTALYAMMSLAFCAGQTLAKFPLIEILIIIVVVQHSRGELNLKAVGKVLIISVALLAILYIAIMGAEGGDLIGLISHRIFVAQYVGLPVTMEVFPKDHPFIEIGSLLGIIGRLFSYEQISYSLITMNYANPWGVSSGTAGYLSTIGFAEGYAVGGTVGMIVAALIAYMYVSILDKLYSRSYSILERSVYLLLIIKIPMLMIDSVSAMLVNYGLIMVMVFASLLVPFLNRNQYWRNRC